MSEIENLFDEEYLVPNVKGAAFFILLYEHFEGDVISTVWILEEDYALLMVFCIQALTMSILRR